MPRHTESDVSFDVPRHWENKSIVAFAAPSRKDQPVAPSFVLTRDALGDRESLGAYAERQLTELSRTVDGFELVEKRDTTVGGAPAVAIRFHQTTADGALAQKLVIVESRRRQVLCFTVTAAKSDAEQMDPLFERMLGSVAFEASAPSYNRGYEARDGEGDSAPRGGSS